MRTKRRNLYTFVLLFILFIGPIIAANFLFHHHRFLSQHTVNRGLLLQPPLQINQLKLRQGNAKPVEISRLLGKWSVMYVAMPYCDALCKKDLFLLRQVHIALGKDADRVQNILLTSLPQKHSSTQPTELLHWYVNAEEFKQFFNSNGSAAVYLIDPKGNIFMSYPAHINPRALHHDMTRVLKVSSIG